MGSDLISILLPVYNEEKYLRYTLESIVHQSFKNYKCIIGFNGTKDSSKEIAYKIVGADERFILVDYGNDKGKSRTLNKMLSIVESKYISLIDGDDIWDSKKLEKQIQFCGIFDVIGTLTYYINEDNIPTNMINLSEKNDEIIMGFKNGHNQIINSSAIIRTECLIKSNGWDESTEGMEDFDLWLRLMKTGNTFYNLQEFLVYHRIHENSNFNSRDLKISIDDLLIKNKINE